MPILRDSNRALKAAVTRLQIKNEQANYQIAALCRQISELGGKPLFPRPPKRSLKEWRKDRRNGYKD